MKLYVYVVIAVGIMFTLYLGGIETGGSGYILNSMFPHSNSTNLTVNNIAIDQSTSISGDDVTTFSNIRSYLTGLTFWNIIWIGLLIFGAASLLRFSGLSFSFSPDVRVAGAAVSLAIFIIISLDFFSLWKFLEQITGGTGFIFGISMIIMSLYLIGFSFSIYKFAVYGE